MRTMITVKRLKELLAKVPDEAEVRATVRFADFGLLVTKTGRPGNCWIKAEGTGLIDTHTIGFDEEGNEDRDQ